MAPPPAQQPRMAPPVQQPCMAPPVQQHRMAPLRYAAAPCAAAPCAAARRIPLEPPPRPTPPATARGASLRAAPHRKRRSRRERSRIGLRPAAATKELSSQQHRLRTIAGKASGNRQPAAKHVNGSRFTVLGVSGARPKRRMRQSPPIVIRTVRLIDRQTGKAP